MASTLDVNILLAPEEDDVVLGLQRSPGNWLGPSARKDGNTWLVDMHIGRRQQLICVRIGPIVDVPNGTARKLSWAPVATDNDNLPTETDEANQRLNNLPSFDGILAAQKSARLEMSLRGEYHSRYGLVAGVLDALMMRKVAEVTADQVLHNLHAHLTTVPESPMHDNEACNCRSKLKRA